MYTITPLHCTPVVLVPRATSCVSRRHPLRETTQQRSIKTRCTVFEGQVRAPDRGEGSGTVTYTHTFISPFYVAPQIELFYSFNFQTLFEKHFFSPYFQISRPALNGEEGGGARGPLGPGGNRTLIIHSLSDPSHSTLSFTLLYSTYIFRLHSTYIFLYILLFTTLFTLLFSTSTPSHYSPPV